MSTNLIELFPDMKIDKRLLPSFLVENNNSKRIEAYKVVLKMAIFNFLSIEQRQAIKMFYWEKKTKTQIAQELGITNSAVCKRIHAGEDILRTHMKFIEQVYPVIISFEEADF